MANDLREIQSRESQLCILDRHGLGFAAAGVIHEQAERAVQNIL